eukprot:SAG11_NODE_10449_length_831_cov_0.928962_2_plen_121_part_01
MTGSASTLTLPSAAMQVQVVPESVDPTTLTLVTQSSGSRHLSKTLVREATAAAHKRTRERCFVYLAAALEAWPAAAAERCVRPEADALVLGLVDKSATVRKSARLCYRAMWQSRGVGPRAL